METSKELSVALGLVEALHNKDLGAFEEVLYEYCKTRPFDQVDQKLLMTVKKRLQESLEGRIGEGGLQ